MKWFKKKETPSEEKSAQEETDSQAVTRGLLIFAHPTTVIDVEHILRDEGYEIRVVSPPPSYRTGCDLSVEFPMEAEAAITELLNTAHLTPLDVVPITCEGMEPLHFVRKKWYGDKYLMVRAANMKITVDVETKIIVNISGGGCPDVPYLATALIGQHISEAPDLTEVGFSLCAYSLNTAREELVREIGA
ncbi:MAG: DUF3343 domain-containing protein [Candidatus Electrothrix aestuarii]|jgi:hypothetical protein|uniref:DUF3343 domain-containing protein n=1 Tax=Candidatus Electrothrix aestuarii TaxID=3062594 RepID=A0AAU8LVJ9_9BACT|nr:DUF3343 domain-containing protein [Candidatus Electrothrix aestuarii]WPD22495.1 MAG: DUF3343 domain-containing protein [Candidatus Electrothrix sp. GW3-3]